MFRYLWFSAYVQVPNMPIYCFEGSPILFKDIAHQELGQNPSGEIGRSVFAQSSSKYNLDKVGTTAHVGKGIKISE